MALNHATYTVALSLKMQLRQMENATVRALTERWVYAWDTIQGEYAAAIDELLAAAKGGRVTAAAVRKSVRLRNALQTTATLLDELYAATDSLTETAVRQAVAAALAAHEQAIGTQLPPPGVGSSIGFTRVSAEAISAIITRTVQQIHSSTLPLADEVVSVIRKELIRGILVGDNPRKVAARMMKNTESRFNWGLSRALNIARTEMLEASRESTRQGNIANADVLTAWMWIATLDSRTCPSCLSKHGETFPPDEPGPNDHQSGRCTGVPITKSWEELGIEGIQEPPPIIPDAKAWFDSQPEAVQKEIMGPGRLAAYQDGRISWSDMSVKRENPNWRVSYATPSLKDQLK